MRTRAMTACCPGSPPTAIIWPGLRRRIAPPPSRPGGRLWPDWRRRPVWRRMIQARALAAPEQITLALSETLTAALTRQARQQGLTLNTFVQAAWAILLGRLTGRDDVVFGVTVAGRPPEIAGIETMVGLFINTLPLRVKLTPAKPLRALLQETAGQPVQADRAPASRPGRDPGARRIGRAVRHPGGVRELSGRRARGLAQRRPAGCVSPTSAGTMPRIIR